MGGREVQAWGGYEVGGGENSTGSCRIFFFDFFNLVVSLYRIAQKAQYGGFLFFLFSSSTMHCFMGPGKVRTIERKRQKEEGAIKPTRRNCRYRTKYNPPERVLFFCTVLYKLCIPFFFYYYYINGFCFVWFHPFSFFLTVVVVVFCSRIV
ncbi:hypothetical protein L873DRAFT_481519 [Choiromyces venosus 120613-1]|uniref:Uncharacterized protein n=1 Tax=Choiromyces venosus 120613-1 TaxID=1336337 RepID=A0A3N4JYV5_9PEZI|nr:hypothetical protein L873DRAFT_481519 [Choiromyces venosus 120613-1]